MSMVKVGPSPLRASLQRELHLSASSLMELKDSLKESSDTATDFAEAEAANIATKKAKPFMFIRVV